ncbi:Uncharacterised protein [Aedoeadaptatus ivorii]|uniref:Uncharacterized protein n=1 Tax=Aedoeadaptatus ivorii TaxID=54006 RepID=A0A3S4YKI5_9FIRM|nr:hypothetical protein [Peptoniphilus ivorii]MDQ0507602.1 Sec-independent protein translocase protein TatA [Peptoniphilus ivorii]VEJ35242.1 Uncharacterised protein [Peptoniphilus ivorii]
MLGFAFSNAVLIVLIFALIQAKEKKARQKQHSGRNASASKKAFSKGTSVAEKIREAQAAIGAAVSENRAEGSNAKAANSLRKSAQHTSSPSKRNPSNLQEASAQAAKRVTQKSDPYFYEKKSEFDDYETPKAAVPKRKHPFFAIEAKDPAQRAMLYREILDKPKCMRK